MTDGNFRRILIATDGSRDALAATRMGGELARAQGAKVILVHAVAMPPVIPGAVAPPTDYMTYLDEQAKHAIAASEKVLKDYGVESEAVVVRSSPAANVILNVADDRDVDLIVIGHRGMGAIGRLFLGSVSNRVVHESRRPVLLAPPPPKDEDEEDAG